MSMLSLALMLYASISSLSQPSLAEAAPNACRVGCKQAKTVCLAQASSHLQTLLAECATASSGRRQCRRQAKAGARTEKRACRGLVRHCHKCCAAGGTDCATIGCGAFLTSWGTVGGSDAGGLAVDRNGDVFLGESTSVQKFANNGTLL